MNTKRKIISLFFFIPFVFFGQRQKRDSIITGKVTYLTSQNVYVKFGSTEHLNVGDTLKYLNRVKPCLLIEKKSSRSVVCTPINGSELKKGDEVYYLFRKGVKSPKPQNVTEVVQKTGQNKIKPVQKSREEQDIYGRFSISGYSMISNLRDTRHRLLYRFSLNARNLFHTGISLETYMHYRQYFDPDRDGSSTKNRFNIYNLALSYKINPGLFVLLGRKINNNLSSVGPIDGLQAEMNSGRFFAGGFVGFKPDLVTFDLNTDLFQYGGYAGFKTNDRNFLSHTTLGYIEQRNTDQIDRRYAYFQHSSSVYRKLYLFASMELDLYSKINDVTANNLRLTNLFASVRYRFNRKIDLNISYDTRKRIIYYETYKSDIERLLDDDLARQGLRFRLNVRPIPYMYFSISYSKRFQSDQQNKSDNYYAYLSYTKLPGIGGGLSLNYNFNSSNYSDSRVASVRYSRNFLKGKLLTDVYFRYANFDYFYSHVGKRAQNYYGLELSYNVTRTMLLGVSGEYTASDTEDYYRIYARIIKRFHKKN